MVVANMLLPSKLPTISIVTPSFNQGAYLEKTICSVLDQLYPALEFIVIDGGSTDGSIDIIRKYENQLTYWVSEPDSGQSNAINKGFKQATGTLLCWLNSDDCLVEGALNVIAEMFQNNPHAGAFVGAGEYIDTKGNILLRKEPCEVTFESLYEWLDIFHFMQPSCFFTREAWNSAGGLDESVHYAMDLDLWFKIAKGFTFERTSHLLSRSLVHESAKTKYHKYLSELDSAYVIMSHGGHHQARKALEKIANKLDFFENKIAFMTGGRLFKRVLPILQTILGYDKHISKGSGGCK